MREELQRKIKKNIISLKKDMDAKDLTDYFIQEEILEFSDIEKINGYNPNTSDSRNTCFFGLILGKDDRAYDVLMEALRENNQGFLADQIHKTQVVGAQQPNAGDPGAWISGIPEAVRRRRFVERDLSKLAQCLGSDWQIVASELGLSKVDTDHCVMENQTVTMQIYAALYKWRNKVVNDANLETFVEVLTGCQCTTIDWEQIKRIANNMTQR